MNLQSIFSEHHITQNFLYYLYVSYKLRPMGENKNYVLFYREDNRLFIC